MKFLLPLLSRNVVVLVSFRPGPAKILKENFAAPDRYQPYFGTEVQPGPGQIRKSRRFPFSKTATHHLAFRSFQARTNRAAIVTLVHAAKKIARDFNRAVILRMNLGHRAQRAVGAEHRIDVVGVHFR